MAQENEPNPQTPPPNPPAAGYTTEQLHAAIEKARNEERTKLRAEIETAQQNVKTLQGQVDQLKGENQKLTADLQAIQASQKPEGGIDLAQYTEQIANRMNAEWQSKFVELETRLTQEQQVRQKLTLEQLRARLIQANGGESALIPILVTGSSEAELLASIEASKAEFQRIRQLVSGGTPPPTQQQIHGQGGGLPPAMPVPAGGGAPAGGQPQPLTDVRKMDLKDFAKNRQELKRQAIGRYANSPVRQ